MPIVSSLRDQLSENIGAVLLDKDEIKRLVEDANGKDPYNVYTSPILPRAVQISEILTGLETDGEERWLLTKVLAWPRTSDQLRQLIVQASRETLAALPKLDTQVASMQQSMRGILGETIPDDVLDDLRPKREALIQILQQISDLLLNKIQHECLHVLHLKLIHGSVLDQLDDDKLPSYLQDSPKEIRAACAQARNLSGAADVQHDWVDKLEGFADRIERAFAAGDAEAASDVLYEAQRQIRIYLCHLNEKVLETAKHSSLHELLVDLPGDLQNNTFFKSFRFSIYDLKATVLARALEHAIWQDVDNELALLSDLAAVPTSQKKQFGQHWVALKLRIRLLGSLDSDAKWWNEKTKASVKNIGDELANERVERDIRPLFETFSRILREQFLFVDALLKADCKSLQKIDSDLRQLLRSIGHE
jgi:hypothetical protein